MSTERPEFLDFWEETDNSSAMYVANAFVMCIEKHLDLKLKGFKTDDEKEGRVYKRGRAIEKALKKLGRELKEHREHREQEV